MIRSAYRLLLPKITIARTEYPLVVNYINGGWCRERNNLIQCDSHQTPPNYVFTAENRWKIIPAVLYFTQSPTNSGFGGISDDRSFWPGIRRPWIKLGKRIPYLMNNDALRSRNVPPEAMVPGIYWSKTEKICCRGHTYMRRRRSSLAARIGPIILSGHFMVRRIKSYRLPFNTKHDSGHLREAGGSQRLYRISARHLIWARSQKSTPGYWDCVICPKKRTD